MSTSTAFLPQTVTQTLACSASTSVGAQWTNQGEANSDCARIYNNTNGVAWVVFGATAPTAAIGSGIPVPPVGTQGQVSFVRVLPGYSYVAAMLAAGATAGNVYITRGDGGT